MQQISLLHQRARSGRPEFWHQRITVPIVNVGVGCQRRLVLANQ